MTKNFRNLLVAQDGSVLSVALNRPEVRNALDETTLRELADFFSASPLLKDCRAVVLKGAGPDFCAGADIRWMRRAADYSPARNRKDAALLADALQAVDECPLPVVAQVHGGTYGGGLGLVAASDIVIAADNVKMRFSEGRLGILPSIISAYVFPKIGPSQARRLYLTGELFGAQTAQAIGLVHIVAAEPDLDRLLPEIVSEILLNGPEANRRAKAYLRRLAALSPKARKKFSIETLVEARSGQEAKEGLSAFLEKRRPSWVQNRG